MITRKHLLTAFVAFLTMISISAALAWEVVEKQVRVSIEQENDQDARVELMVNDRNYRFTLPQLSEGETRTLATDDGGTVTASKQDGKVTVTADGEEIRIPHANAELTAGLHVMGDDAFRVDANTVIISGAELDEATRQTITDAIRSADADKKVVFTGGGHGNVFMFRNGDDEDEMEWLSEGEGEHQIIIHSDDGENGKKVEKRVRVIRK